MLRPNSGVIEKRRLCKHIGWPQVEPISVEVTAVFGAQLYFAAPVLHRLRLRRVEGFAQDAKGIGYFRAGPY